WSLSSLQLHVKKPCGKNGPQSTVVEHPYPIRHDPYSQFQLMIDVVLRAHSRRQLFANAAIAASRVGSQPCVGVPSSLCPKACVHIHDMPTGTAAAFMMRPTTTPSQTTSKSSSFHSPDGREVEARLRARQSLSILPSQRAPLHSITSSARPRSVIGTVRPSAL